MESVNFEEFLDSLVPLQDVLRKWILSSSLVSLSDSSCQQAQAGILFPRVYNPGYTEGGQDGYTVGEGRAQDTA